MTNREFYAEQILDIACQRRLFGVDKKTNNPYACRAMVCGDCTFYGKPDCAKQFTEWCNSEYIEPCPFEKDELVEVSDDGKEWHLRFFSHIENGVYHTVFAFHKSNETPRTTKWGFCQKYGTLGGLVKESEE